MAHVKQDTLVRQASKIADVRYIIPLSEGEARQELTEISNRVEEVCERLVGFHEREGWKALGYPSMVACMRAEMNLSKSRGYQLLAYGRVKQNIESGKNSTIVESHGKNRSHHGKKAPLELPPITESQAREIAKVPDNEQAVVYQKAVESAPDHKPTAAQVKRVVAEYKQMQKVRYQGIICQVTSVNTSGTLNLRTMVGAQAWRDVEPEAVEPFGSMPAAANVKDTPERPAPSRSGAALRERAYALIARATDEVLVRVVDELERGAE